MNLLHGVSRQKIGVRFISKRSPPHNGSSRENIAQLNLNGTNRTSTSSELPSIFDDGNSRAVGNRSSDHFPSNPALQRNVFARTREITTNQYSPAPSSLIDHEFELARSLKNDARALVLLIEHRQKRLPMGLSLSNRMLLLCKEMDYYTLAISVFDEMVESGKVDERTFRTMIEFHAKERFFLRACQTFSMLLNHVNMPTLDTFNLLLSFLMKSGKYEMIWPLAETMKETGVAFDAATLGLLLKVTVYSRDDDKYDEIMQMILDMGFKHSDFHLDLISAFYMVGRMKNANDLFDKMKADGEELTLKTYVKMVNINFINRQFKRVLELFESMKAEGLKPNKYIYARVFLSMEELNRVEDIALVKQQPDFKQTMRANFVYFDKNDWATRSLNNYEFLGVRASTPQLFSLPLEE